jgi:hypothetical protein
VRLYGWEVRLMLGVGVMDGMGIQHVGRWMRGWRDGRGGVYSRQSE